MKKLLLHIILFSYAIVLFKPAFPYLNDVIAHALFLQQHMATVHFENGKYHVHAEMNKELKSQSPSKDLDLQKKAFSQNEYFSTEPTDQMLPLAIETKKNFFNKASSLHNNYLQSNYRPPKV